MSTDNKRLALIVPVFPQHSETFIVSKFVGLVDRGWDVHIVCQRINSQAWAQFPSLKADPDLKRRVHPTWPHQPRWLAALLLIPGVFWCFATSPRSTLHYLLRGWAQFGWGVIRHFYADLPIIRLNPKILHFEFGALAVGRTYLKDLLGVKLSVSFRGYDLNFSGLDQPGYYAEVWQNADACHFLGQDLWQRALRRGCPADLPHAMIPPALDISAFPAPQPVRPGPLGSPQQPLRILSVGRLHWKKGYDYTLQAVKELAAQDVHCIYRIIGAGEYQAALAFARYEMEMGDYVEFCGSLPQSQVIDHYLWADVFLHGAVSEGFCNAVLEAQAMGLPVVSTDADGLPENIADGETGFIVPRRNPDTMAEKLALLAQDSPLRQQMGTAGRKRVEQHFQLVEQLNAFELFYLKRLEISPREKAI